jgi:hypothetical protein
MDGTCDRDAVIEAAQVRGPFQGDGAANPRVLDIALGAYVRGADLVVRGADRPGIRTGWYSRDPVLHAPCSGSRFVLNV